MARGVDRVQAQIADLDHVVVGDREVVCRQHLRVLGRDADVDARVPHLRHGLDVIEMAVCRQDAPHAGRRVRPRGGARARWRHRRAPRRPCACRGARRRCSRRARRRSCRSARPRSRSARGGQQPCPARLTAGARGPGRPAGGAPTAPGSSRAWSRNPTHSSGLGAHGGLETRRVGQVASPRHGFRGYARRSGLPRGSARRGWPGTSSASSRRLGPGGGPADETGWDVRLEWEHILGADRWVGAVVAGRVRRTRRRPRATDHLQRGVRPRERAGSHLVLRRGAVRADADPVRHRRAEAAVSPEDPARRGVVVPGLLRAQCGERSREHPDPRRPSTATSG